MSVAGQWTRQLCNDYLALSRGFCSSASLRKGESTKKKVWYSPQVEPRKESWNIPHDRNDPRNQIPDNEWQGILHEVSSGKKGASVTLLSYMQRGVDLRPKSIKKWWKSVQNDAAAEDQKFKAERVAALGFDLGAAHFIVHRGGRVRFKDTKMWVQKDEDEDYNLARNYQPGVFVEEVEAKGTNLVYEGLESMKQLKHLKSLSVAGCPLMDDWCIDRICGEYKNTLQHLDISGCTKVTQYGVGALVRLRHLRTLNLHGLEGIKDIKLICLLLLEDLPELKISGIDYLGHKDVQQS